MLIAVWIGLLLSLLSSISDEVRLEEIKGVETRLISESVQENNRVVQKGWSQKHTFKNRKSSKSAQRKTLQNSENKSALRVAGVIMKDKFRQAKINRYGFNSVLNSLATKWEKPKPTNLNAAQIKTGSKIDDDESVNSSLPYERIKRGIIEPDNRYDPASEESERLSTEKQPDWEHVYMLGSDQVHKEYVTQDISALEFQRKRSARNRRLNGIGSSQFLPCQDTVSCQGRCSSSFQASYNEKLACYCDIYCEIFQDCCHNFDEFCQVLNGSVTHKEASGGPFLQPGADIPSDQASKENPTKNQLWNCHGSVPGIKVAKGFRMVSSCPQFWVEDDVYYRCRNLSALDEITLDNYQYPPVYTSSGVVYHNVFCAQCNGVASENLRSYHLSLNCDFTPPDHLSTSEKVKFLFSYCPRRTWEPQQGDPRRYCLKIQTDCCENSSLALEGECRNTKPRLVNDNTCIYKNIKCALCKGKDISQIRCGPHGSFNDPCKETQGSVDVPNTRPISIILDFNNPKHLTVKCEKGTIFDEHLGQCRKTLSSFPSQSKIDKYRVVLWVQFTGKKPAQQVRKTFSQKNSTVAQEIAYVLQVSSSHVDSVSIEELPILWKIEFVLHDADSEHSDVLGMILNFTSPFNITFANATFTVIKASKQAISCTSMQLYQPHEYSTANNSSAVFINNTGEYITYADYYVMEKLANHSRGILVCRKMGNCSGKWVMLEEEEFTVMANRSLFVSTSKIVYSALEQLWINRTVYVCKDYPSKSSQSDALSILTIVCMSISIAALVYVLGTYTMFSELRTPPGINLMNLGVSILLSQLLWVLGSGQIDKPILCTVIAVLLHYLFLVSFLWTSIIAFDTWRAFQCSPNRLAGDTKRGLRAMLTGWLPVMVYVIICVVIDKTNTSSIGYPSPHSCWMSNLYFFAVPMGCFLLFNIVLYILTLKAIQSATGQARAAVEHKNNSKLFGVYVRIASVMGFTWISGFLITVNPIFDYVFGILSSFQGVYIALAFGLNQRVRNLYLHRFAFLACTSLLVVDGSSCSDNKQSSCRRHDTTDTQL